MDKQSFEERLMQALLEVPIEEKDIRFSVSNMASFIRENLSENSTFFDFKTKIETTAKLIGVTKAKMVAAALKQPPLFCQSPTTLNANIESTAKLVGVTKAKMVSTALKRSQLFCQSPETLNANIEGTATLVGVTKAKMVAAALKKPSLFCQSPETLNANIEGTAELVGVTKAQMVTAALKRSPLFYQSPETLNANIEGTAKLVGVTKAQIVTAALKQPQLFCQSPETIKRNTIYIQDAHQKGYILSDNVVTGLLRQPALFSLAPRNTHLRSIDAHINQTPKTLSTFFTATGSNKKQVEARIIAHYTDRFNRTGKGERTLQVLTETGIISKLPEWVTKPEKELRQRNRKSISLTI